MSKEFPKILEHPGLSARAEVLDQLLVSMASHYDKKGDSGSVAIPLDCLRLAMSDAFTAGTRAAVVSMQAAVEVLPVPGEDPIDLSKLFVVADSGSRSGLHA